MKFSVDSYQEKKTLFTYIFKEINSKMIYRLTLKCTPNFCNAYGLKHIHCRVVTNLPMIRCFLSLRSSQFRKIQSFTY
ncbi:hypothetical protein L1887_18740 [Cichorium endivia]|nr:hypothetical protein L1887_18740 [Cichorium endivia]